jgi:hypothetical protein
MQDVTVTIGDRTYTVDADEPFTFGRSADCTVCLDPDDVGVSRQAGKLEYDGGTWWLINSSGVRPLGVIDDLGFRSVLAPGRRMAVEAQVRVVVDGSTASHTMTVYVPEPPPTADEQPPVGRSTAVGEGVMVTHADRLAMVALFAGYLHDPPKHDPYPKSYAAAAARLGWPRTTLVKRIEYLRSRLTNAGVPNLVGWNALANLAEYALATGLITKDDLKLLTPGS